MGLSLGRLGDFAGGLVGSFTGQNAADAAEAGSAAQVAASERAMKLLRGDLAPFRQLGVDQIEGASSLASDPATQMALLQNNPEFQQMNALSTDPQAQVDFLSNNPLFDSLRGQASDDIFANQAARGKLGGSGTQELLQNRFLQMGNDLINQQINRTSGAISQGQGLIDTQLNRQLPLLQMGQASAAQTGAGSANIATDIGNSQAAALIAAQNAKDTGVSNLLGTGLGLFAGGGFSDERLKTNIKKIGSKSGVNVYSWDWNDKGEAIGLKGRGVGHIAQQVKEIHPELVQEMKNGYLAINYSTDKTVRIH